MSYHTFARSKANKYLLDICRESLKTRDKSFGSTSYPANRSITREIRIRPAYSVLMLSELTF